MFFVETIPSDHPISLFRDSGNSDSTSLIRVEASFNLDSCRLVNSQLISIVILVPEDSESEKLSNSSQDRKASPSGSSLYALFLTKM